MCVFITHLLLLTGDTKDETWDHAHTNCGLCALSIVLSPLWILGICTVSHRNSQSLYCYCGRLTFHHELLSLL